MRLLYHLGILIYLAGIRLAALYSGKARQWRRGRKYLFRRMSRAAGGNKPLAWFHCASLGEFEQGRPVMEAFRKHFPACNILLTFFSPSGYTVRQSYAGADHVFYMPADTPANASRFLELWNPAIAVFIKYDYWYNFLHELNKRNIPTVMVSAIFQPRQPFFRPYGFWFRQHLQQIDHFFVQDRVSEDLLRGIGIQHLTLSGDTRFDRVVAIAAGEQEVAGLAAFCAQHPVLVAGSTWEADEKLLADARRLIPHPTKIIIAPHEIKETDIRRVAGMFGGRVLRYSHAAEGIPPDTEVLVIDSIGLLSALYRYGHVAYIGGGFGQGIHNILEAATFGLPVIFGPRHQTFREAVDLIRLGGAFPVSSAEQTARAINVLLEDKSLYGRASATCRQYVAGNAGATSQVIDGIKRLLRSAD